jgi:hypothetical protein
MGEVVHQFTGLVHYIQAQVQKDLGSVEGGSRLGRKKEGTLSSIIIR